jgi:acetyl-CoA carboxylase biotin carboxyl carrier protein
MTREILAPLAGEIVRLEVEVGDEVEEDDEVIILDALKMETPVFAPCDGTITDIKVKEGDSVEEDDLLALIEE